MGNHAINRFGTNGPSANLFRPGLLINFDRCWLDDWDDGEEPPHTDEPWIPIDYFSGDDDVVDGYEMHAYRQARDPFDILYGETAEENLDAMLGSAEDVLKDYAEDEWDNLWSLEDDFDGWLDNETEEIVNEEPVAPYSHFLDDAEEIQEEIGLPLAACYHPDHGERRLANWRFGKNQRPKAKRSMPWWRQRPGCRRTIRVAQLQETRLDLGFGMEHVIHHYQIA